MSKAVVSTDGHLIDLYCKYQTNSHLLKNNNLVYSCVLNFTCIKTNSNKFYIMQLVVSGTVYCVFIRYGRIGEKGTSTHKEFTSMASACKFFHSQFQSKTANQWSKPEEFVPKTGKYYLTLNENVVVSSSSSSESEISDDMDPRVTNFLRTISNVKYIKNTLIQLEIGGGSDKAPLGKINSKQIDKAYVVLQNILKAIGKNLDLEDLSSEFYTLIPISCGRFKPPTIDTKELVAKNLNLLNELSQMAIGTTTITRMAKTSMFTELYDEIKTEIVPLNPNGEMFQILATYLKNSMSPVHNFHYDIIDILQFTRQDEIDSYEKFSKNIHNKTLLFHGTRVCNIISILKQGLIVDPSKLGINVQITGKMFGLGIYCANSASKSLQYCAFETSDRIACLFVLEVALGNMLEKTSADVCITAKNLPKSYHSVWGKGRSSYTEFDDYDDGTRIPAGTLQPIPANSKNTLYFDEFIIYHEPQATIRYCIMLKMR